MRLSLAAVGSGHRAPWPLARWRWSGCRSWWEGRCWGSDSAR